MFEDKVIKKILFAFIGLNLFLNIYGNNWGLPSRWHSDEKVSNVLHMANNKTLVDPGGAFFHPTGYHLTLMLSFVPVYGYLKIINYPLTELKKAALVSWDYMAGVFPGFSTGIYIYARIISAIFGALTVYCIFLLGKELYNKKNGIISAGFLSVCMGFIGVNHFAKYISLVNLSIAAAILLCVKALNTQDFKKKTKYLSFAFFVSGFACSVHINAPLLLLPVFFTFIFLYIKDRLLMRYIKFFIWCIVLFVLGLLLGTPSILTNFWNYMSGFGLFLGGQSSPGEISIMIGALNFIFETMSVYGVPLFLMVCMGIIRLIFSWKKITVKEVVVFSFISAYFLIMGVFGEDKYPQTKHVIAIVPLALVFAAKFISDIVGSKRIPSIMGYLLFFIIFTYSLCYSFKADLVFKHGDTRYKSTQWIVNNIPKGVRIEVFDQLNEVASGEIIKDYEIIYLGRSSKYFKGNHFFRWIEVDGRAEYLQHINQNDSGSDYMLFSCNDVGSLLSVKGESHIPGLNRYLRDLFSDKKRFRIVKIFKPTNMKIKTSNGLFYFTNFLWDPIPCYRATANTIYIFKRVS